MDSFEKFQEKARTANVVPVIETLPADLLTPLAVYLKLSATDSNSFLLESVEGGESLARYSFIGAGREMIVSGNDFQTVRNGPNGISTAATPLMSFLREHFAQKRVADTEDLPSFIGGAIGYIGFACTEWFEPSLRKEIAKPDRNDAAFMFFRSVVAFDHAKQVIKIVSLVFTDEADDENRLRDLFESARQECTHIKDLLESDQPFARHSDTGDTASEAAVESNWSKEGFENAVRAVKELILAGECYQVVLSQCFSKRTAASAVSIYRAIRSLNPSPYMFLLQFDDKSIIGASPEMLVRSRGRSLEYRPIAGTRPRGSNAAEDTRLAEEMKCDKKEVAEHLMLVDLGRNDLGRVAEYGSVTVDNLMSVEKYSHVQHLVTDLRATLREGLDRFDAIAACFPAGTVSGAPKVRAIEIIQKLEPTDRGIYAGAVGYFDYAGNMDTCITIRTLVLENGVARIQAGAGIVADSVPELEYEETTNKARALLKALEIAEKQRL